ncbi:DUF2235 domain-containing protein [Sphingomonas sp. KR1UV-12]|uniref:DUF2235 domain-containing protein n=1 Tax=Sphingomonas aurea TaxID=3063994 RepID=A0ABT9EIX5_9SPHN|nr:DUF2235 domain-containing protein [Sphingomonas sp. KR1UV-12]MDP1026909.1 DUF2235 domain-containing protein [Sphingomonas sp. KR1UV-12]
MSKTILIFSDGTGQLGGLRPDQRLSNVYKMYRAMRLGPDPAIKPSEQVAFYDAGLGAGETGGLTFKRVRNVLAAAVGTGIDENVIDCGATAFWLGAGYVGDWANTGELEGRHENHSPYHKFREIDQPQPPYTPAQ